MTAMEGQKLSPVTINALRTAICEGELVRFTCGNLGADYAEVKEVLDRIGGGKWIGGKTQGVKMRSYAQSLVRALLETGVMPAKNPHAFFPTPAPVIETLFELMGVSEWPRRMRILEPSAGVGAFINAILTEALSGEEPRHWVIDACEIDPLNRSTLASVQSDVLHLVGDDFLQYKPDFLYDAVVMNPPFSVAGDKTAYMTHIYHAWSMLKPCGTLGAIVPTSWLHNSDKKSLAFLEFCAEFGEWMKIDAGAFKESGTGIPTIALCLKKESQEWRNEPHNGFKNDHQYRAALYVSCNDDRGLSDAMSLPAPERAAAVRAVYESVAMRTNRAGCGEFIKLTDADHADLLQHCEDLYGLSETTEAEPVIVFTTAKTGQMEMFA